MAAIVASIVTAFENAMAISKRIQHDSKPKRAHKKNADVNHNHHGAEETEDRLRLSLQTGPKIINSEYRKNTRRFGSKYRRGDDIARYSLTLTLIALDTGLVKIRSIIMSDDSSLRNELARRSLLSLSENSASDAVSCLEELRQRIATSSAGVPQFPSSVKVASSRHRRRHGVHRNRVLGEKQQEYHHARCDKKHGMKVASEGDNTGKPKGRHMEAKEANKKSSFHKATKQKSIPSPVRATSKDSSVSLATVSGGKFRTKSRPSQPRTAWESHRSQSRVDSTQHLQPRSVASPPGNLSVSSAPPSAFCYTPLTPIMERRHRHQQAAERQLEQQQKEQTHNFDEIFFQQVKPPEVPETRKNDRFSILSFESGSTKIGEIPQHKWLTPWVVPPPESDPVVAGINWDEANVSESDAVSQKQKPRTGLKFWKRFGRNSSNNNGRWL